MKRLILSLLISSICTTQCNTSTEATIKNAPISEAQKIERWQETCRDAASAAYSKHSNSGIIASFFVGSVGSLIIQGATMAAAMYCFTGTNQCATCNGSLDPLPRKEIFAIPAALAGLVAAWYVNKNNNKQAARAEAFLEYLVLTYTNHPEELPDIVAEPMQQLITYYQEFKELPADSIIAPLYLSIAAFDRA
jgi:hypothetical protein